MKKYLLALCAAFAISTPAWAEFPAQREANSFDHIMWLANRAPVVSSPETPYYGGKEPCDQKVMKKHHHHPKHMKKHHHKHHHKPGSKPADPAQDNKSAQ